LDAAAFGCSSHFSLATFLLLPFPLSLSFSSFFSICSEVVPPAAFPCFALAAFAFFPKGRTGTRKALYFAPLRAKTLFLSCAVLVLFSLVSPHLFCLFLAPGSWFFIPNSECSYSNKGVGNANEAMGCAATTSKQTKGLAN
jgi:hypothetical protein